MKKFTDLVTSRDLEIEGLNEDFMLAVEDRRLVDLVRDLGMPSLNGRQSDAEIEAQMIEGNIVLIT
jgi:hypothetical protein